MKVLDAVKVKARSLQKQTYTLYLVSKHKRTPWYAKVLIVAIVCYALSPIDIVPDFIPFLGYLDDLIIIPAAIVITIKLIPKDIYRDCQREAEFGQIETMG